LTIQPQQNSGAGHESLRSKSALTLHTMAGRSHIDLAATCLSSIVKYYDQPIHVVVHDDGTTRPEDVERFQQKVPGSTFIFKRDADPVVNGFLARYPACRRLRDNLVYGLKIFDIQILEEGPELSYTDCDILFLRPVSRFFRLPDDPAAGGVFMKDPRQAYCLTPAQLMRNKTLHLADRLNGGLLHFRREAFDWDLVEWFLSHDEYVIHPYWKEQTAWSALAAATKCWFWDEKQVRVIKHRAELTPQVAVAHYVSSYRHFMEYVPADGREDETPVVVPMFRFKECTTARFVADHARRIVRGTRRRLLSFADNQRRQKHAAPSFPG
jgi:hypothetical protein